MDNLVEKLEKQYIPYLETLKAKFEDKYPNSKFHILSYPVGENTSFQGHTICLECVLPDTPPDQSDSLAIMIQLTYLTTRTRLMADVSWVTGIVEAQLKDWTTSNDWLEVTNDTLNQLDEIMPKLCQDFEEAIQRGHPL